MESIGELFIFNGRITVCRYTSNTGRKIFMDEDIAILLRNKPLYSDAEYVRFDWNGENIYDHKICNELHCR